MKIIINILYIKQKLTAFAAAQEQQSASDDKNSNE
jgi:hypothetical protein